jgi:hypothetical protein
MILVVTILLTIEALYSEHIFILILFLPGAKLLFIPEILELCCEGLIIVFLLGFSLLH